MEQIEKTPENIVDALETALKAIECFQACEKAAVDDMRPLTMLAFLE